MHRRRLQRSIPITCAKRIWGEEGASVGDLYADGGNAWGAGSAQNFRCVRNLGIDITQANDIKKETYPKQAFEYKDEARVKVYNKYTTPDSIQRTFK